MGQIIYLNIAPVGWNSKALNRVTGICFNVCGTTRLEVYLQSLKYLQMKVNLSMLVLIDNIGAIEMLDMKINKCKTKHVDTKYHWIREFIEDNFVNVKYMKSEDNVLDVCTKNLPAQLFKRHSEKLVSDAGLFTRCNTRMMGKARMYQDTNGGKAETLEEFAQPMGEILRYSE